MWLIRPGTTQHWLCKLTTTPATGVEQGEDWAEVVSTQVARALSVPCAQTCLCTQDGQRGSLSLSVRPFGYDLVEGKVLLQTENVPGYVPYEVGGHAADPQRPGVERPGHTLENIRRVLDQVEPPDGWMGPSTATGFDVFVGYLVLDALVANRDRHEENWAVLRAQTNNVADRVSPSTIMVGPWDISCPKPPASAVSTRRMAWLVGRNAVPPGGSNIDDLRPLLSRLPYGDWRCVGRPLPCGGGLACTTLTSVPWLSGYRQGFRECLSWPVGSSLNCSI